MHANAGARQRAAALTFLFEGEVLCEVAALVVPTQEEDGAGVVDLQRPEVENALRTEEECLLVLPGSTWDRYASVEWQRCSPSPPQAERSQPRSGRVSHPRSGTGR